MREVLGDEVLDEARFVVGRVQGGGVGAVEFGAHDAAFLRHHAVDVEDELVAAEVGADVLAGLLDADGGVKGVGDFEVGECCACEGRGC